MGITLDYATWAGIVGWIILSYVARWRLTVVEAIVVLNIIGLFTSHYLSRKDCDWSLKVSFLVFFCALPYLLLAWGLYKIAKKQSEPAALNFLSAHLCVSAFNIHPPLLRN